MANRPRLYRISVKRNRPDNRAASCPHYSRRPAGEGNVLVFDNGGWAGYGAPNPGSINGLDNALRDYSRVIEFNPVSLQVVWQYPPPAKGPLTAMNIFGFYSPLISSAQRLPNGNTLITEGTNGRLFEITRDYECVWEYINPFKPIAAIPAPPYQGL